MVKNVQSTPLGKLKALFCLWGVLLLSSSVIAQERYFFNLNNGITIGPARRADTPTIRREGTVNAEKMIGGAAVIVEADDDLRLINFNRALFTEGNQERWTMARPHIKITLPNKDRVANSAQAKRIAVLAEMPQSFPFNDMGRRYYRLPNGDIVVQGITEIAPHFVRVEALAGGDTEYKWDMRLSLNAIPPVTLRRILLQNTDPSNPRSYLDVVELYEAAKRYTEAREVLVVAMQKFPELEVHRTSLKRFDQLAADQLFEAADYAKRRAGQYQFAKRILDSFDLSLLSLETQIKVERQRELAQTETQEREELLQWIEEDIAALPEEASREELLAVVAEVRKYLTADLEMRFADYRRLRSNSTPEQRVALAIGGWILGEGAAIDALPLAVSSVRARELIQQYLAAPQHSDQLLDEIAKLEAGTARYVSRILANMPPAHETTDEDLYPVRMPLDPANPTEFRETTIPGRYHLSIPLKGSLEGKSAEYLVQLPPEYNPFRKYPCVVTMHGAISTPESQLNWWCGAYDPSSERCWGEASRSGYIVIAPAWSQPALPNYNYTEDEHAFVLSAFFDARRRFSIDTDRCFISGLEAGGSGAWDIALAHPDLWAGCLVVCGTVDKFVKQTFHNARYVPFYFVNGEKTAVKSGGGYLSHRFNNERVWDTMLKERTFDVLLTEYHGRGLDHFQEELPRMIEWMNSPSHVRNFAPEKFDARTTRPGDRYFWWFETDQLYQEKMVHPLLPGEIADYRIESRIIKDTNLVDMIQVPADQFTVNLTPDMVDMSRPISVRSRNGNPKRVDPPTDSRTMLRDVRQRADRQHPFWIQITYPR